MCSCTVSATSTAILAALLVLVVTLDEAGSLPAVSHRSRIFNLVSLSPSPENAAIKFYIWL